MNQKKENMEKHFHTTREIVTIVRDAVTIDQFKKLLNEGKPKEIFNSEYSTRVPCWYITEYIDENTVMYYANGAADKTPEKESMENLYESWGYQGLKYCYFNAEELKKAENVQS